MSENDSNSQIEKIDSDNEEEIKKNEEENNDEEESEEEEKKNKNEESEAFESDKENEKISHDDEKIIQKNNENFIKTFPYLKQDSNGKSIFSHISENLYKQYLSKEQKFDIFQELTNNDNLNYHNKPKINKKKNEKIYNNMIARQKTFEENRLNKIKQIKEEQQIELKRNCTFKPNGKNIETRDPKIFYEEQQKFLETKKNSIESISKNLKKNEQVNKKLISKNSEKIIQKRQPQSESKEETLKRLMIGKTIFSKTEPEINENNEKKVKKNMKELTEYSNKLYLQDFQKIKKDREEKKKEKEEIDKEMLKNDLLTTSTKKVFLNKFIKNFQNILNEMYNQKENVEISEEDYPKLLEKLKCISPNNNNNNNNYNNNNKNNPTDELIKLSLTKYLNPKDNKINSNQFILFALSFLGIYKGNDEPIENKNKTENNKIISSTTFIKSNIPEFDFEKYSYTNKTTQKIKKKFILFSSNMLKGWNEEKEKKRKEKNQKKDENKNLEPKKKQKEKSKNNFYLTLNKNLLEKENQLEKLRKQKEEEEMKTCTFQPNASTRPVNKKDVKAKVEKLYADGKVAYMKKLKQKEKDNSESQLEEKYTFMPEIHPLNLEIFENNPLEHDQKLIDGMVKLEKFRNKKLQYLNKEIYTPMKFDIEQKSNRDTFNNFYNKEKIIHNNDYNISNEESFSSKDSDVKDGVAPLLKVEVNIDETNKIVKLLIYPEDDPMKIVEEFCNKYNLGEEKRKKLENIIQEKLSENENEIENENQNENENENENQNEYENENENQNENVNIK